jgi:hypothetical protein
MLFVVDATTLWVAVAGLATTAGAPLLQARVASLSAERAWERDQQAAVYAESLAYAQSRESLIDWAIDPMFSRSSRPLELAHVDLMTARMRLLASRKVFAAWEALRQADDAFHFELSEEYPGLGDHPANSVPANDQTLVALSTSITEFYEVIRREFAK